MMETLLSMPLPMALSLMMISAIAVYFFFKLLGVLEQPVAYVRRERRRDIDRRGHNTTKNRMQSRSQSRSMSAA